MAALCKEILLQNNYLEGEEIKTIYFGGGTPSLLTVDDCKLLMEHIYTHYKVAPGAEISLEANPDDITKEKLKGWKAAGINRLSIGVQSFFEEELQWMNRAHNAGQAHGCIRQSLEAGFTNISIDLIYGSPLLTNEMWEANVKTALRYTIPHLSCYALTVEEKTPLQKLIQLKQKQAVDADKQAHQFMLLMHWLRHAGYEHYEVSNFAKPGFRSRHNSSYWKDEKYLGIGPSAHSYNGSVRQWNVANNQQYISSVTDGLLPVATEQLSSTDKLNEYIMISLRTMEGMDLNKLEQKWGKETRSSIARQLQPYIGNGLVIHNHEHAQLTDEGMLVADGIAAGLFSPLYPKGTRT